MSVPDMPTPATAPFTASARLNNRILTERCALQARQALIEPAIGIPLIALTAHLLIPFVSIDHILPWSLLLAAALFVRTLAAARFLSRRDPRTAGGIANLFSLTSGLTGLLVGACAGLFFDHIDHPTRLALTIVMFAWLAAGVLLHAAFARHALLHGGAVLVQLAAAWALTPESPGLEIAIGVVALGALLARLSVQLTGTLGETMRQRHQVRQLVRRLQSEREAALKKGHSSAHLLATASHDLRQPATSLALLSALIRDRCNDPSLQPLIAGIERSASTLNDLLASLLDLSRLQSGAVAVHKEWLSIEDLFEGLQAEFQERARMQNLDLIIKPAPVLILSDRILLTRALRNLIDNALRYTDRGAVTISAARDNGCTLSVTDTGIGIAPEHLDCIFEEHVRLNQMGRPASAGLGLGLAMVRRIAALIDTAITAHSDGHCGSRFELRFPPEYVTHPELAPPISVTPDQQESTIPNSPADAGSPPRSMPQPRLLLLDDDADVASALAQVLSCAGWDVQIASGAREALLRLSEVQPWRALISDYRLKEGETGLAVAIAAQLLQPELCCVLVSADTSPELQQRVNAHGLKLLTKPISPAELHSALRATTQHTQAS